MTQKGVHARVRISGSNGGNGGQAMHSLKHCALSICEHSLHSTQVNNHKKAPARMAKSPVQSDTGEGSRPGWKLAAARGLHDDHETIRQICPDRKKRCCVRKTRELEGRKRAFPMTDTHKRHKGRTGQGQRQGRGKRQRPETCLKEDKAAQRTVFCAKLAPFLKLYFREVLRRLSVEQSVQF